jgi:hypothetical protein
MADHEIIQITKVADVSLRRADNVTAQHLQRQCKYQAIIVDQNLMHHLFSTEYFLKRADTGVTAQSPPARQCNILIAQGQS